MVLKAAFLREGDACGWSGLSETGCGGTQEKALTTHDGGLRYRGGTVSAPCARDIQSENGRAHAKRKGSHGHRAGA